MPNSHFNFLKLWVIDIIRVQYISFAHFVNTFFLRATIFALWFAGKCCKRSLYSREKITYIKVTMNNRSYFRQLILWNCRRPLEQHVHLLNWSIKSSKMCSVSSAEDRRSRIGDWREENFPIREVMLTTLEMNGMDIVNFQNVNIC